MVFLRSRKAFKILIEKLGRDPTDIEIAAYLSSTGLNVSADTLVWARKVVNVKVISAETKVSSSTDPEGGNINTYMDLFLKADQSNFSNEALMWKVDFNAALDCLNPQERRTIAIRYGLMDGLVLGSGLVLLLELTIILPLTLILPLILTLFPTVCH